MADRLGVSVVLGQKETKTGMAAVVVALVAVVVAAVGPVAAVAADSY